MRRTAVLHVLGGSPRDRAHVRAQLEATRSTRTATVALPERSALLAGGAVAAAFAGSGSRLVHCHGAEGAWAAWKVATASVCRYSVSVRGPDVLLPADSPRRVQALTWARLVVAPSQFLADAVLARRVKHERLVVVPPGVPLGGEPVTHRRERPVVVFTGDFTEQSGVLDVAAVLRAAPVTGRFVGSGPLLAPLQAAGADVTVTDDPAVQRAALDDADLAMCAPRSTVDGDAEPWGRTAVEAQAAGVPVIATRNGGLAQWVHPDGALLVPSHGDIPRSLATALSALLDRRDDWPAMGRAGREHVRSTLEVGARTAELEGLWTALHRRQRLEGAFLRPPEQF